MSTYLISSEKTITRQEGDDADLVITVPALYSMTGATVIFEVQDAKGTVIFRKTPTPALQVITITFDAVDTKGYSGNRRWELQCTKSAKITTIGRGDFIITKEMIK
jgi:hypothetical protein